MQKTFKIGESAIGGIIRVRTQGTSRVTYRVSALDSTTKEIVKWNYAYSLNHLTELLETDYTTHYHAQVITNHFKK